jgi:hypothetical protein
MKIMLNLNSAQPREETPHTVALNQRATSLINDKSIDPQTRALIRYALETNDPWLSELLRRADAGESLCDTDFDDDCPIEEKVEILAEIICRSGSGEDRATRSAALLVLIAAIESSPFPKELAAVAKQLAFTRCSEMNVCGMIESQIAVFETELLAGRSLAG